jgi:hypothetical protein
MLAAAKGSASHSANTSVGGPSSFVTTLRAASAESGGALGLSTPPAPPSPLLSWGAAPTDAGDSFGFNSRAQSRPADCAGLRCES